MVTSEQLYYHTLFWKTSYPNFLRPPSNQRYTN